MARITVCGMFLAMLLGCGKAEEPLGSVSGTVLQQGKPVNGALVLFSNREIGVESTATTDAGGQFTMRLDRAGGLPIGTYKVSVMEPPADRPQPQNGMEFSGPPPKPQVSSIPQRYGDIATSELTANVQRGENNFEFKLQGR